MQKRKKAEKKQLNVRSNLRYMLSPFNACKLRPVGKRGKNGGRRRRGGSSSQSPIAECFWVVVKSFT